MKTLTRILAAAAAAGSALTLLLTSAPAFALGDGQLTMGVRGADFQAAPATQPLALSELGLAVHSDPLWNLPVVTLGLALTYDQMRGSLGVPLSEFSGFGFGPDVEVRHAFGSLTPFARLGYRIGRYHGRGSENWSGNGPAAFELFGGTAGDDPNQTRSKAFNTAGTHVGAGVTWDVAHRVSIVGELDLGYEHMETDTRVISGSSDFNRRDTSFNSRSFLIGSGYSL